MVNLLVAASLGAALPAVADVPAAQPAIFKVADADTTIYLFGTFHALDDDSSWLDPTIEAAFNRSDELVLETLLPEAGAPGPKFTARSAAPSVTPSGAFLATTKMVINASRSRGMQVNSGADMVLRRMAEADGKHVEGLETLELQLRMFDRLRMSTPAQAVKMPATALAKPMTNLSQALAQMQKAWKQGDQAVFVRMLDQLRTASPDTYKMMFTDRNDRWADWVAARMRSPGVVFVAVGAGHLAGRDSLLVHLAQRGVESQRVN